MSGDVPSFVSLVDVAAVGEAETAGGLPVVAEPPAAVGPVAQAPAILKVWNLILKTEGVGCGLEGKQ